MKWHDCKKKCVANRTFLLFAGEGRLRQGAQWLSGTCACMEGCMARAVCTDVRSAAGVGLLVRTHQPLLRVVLCSLPLMAFIRLRAVKLSCECFVTASEAS